MRQLRPQTTDSARSYCSAEVLEALLFEQCLKLFLLWQLTFQSVGFCHNTSNICSVNKIGFCLLISFLLFDLSLRDVSVCVCVCKFFLVAVLLFKRLKICNAHFPPCPLLWQCLFLKKERTTLNLFH